mgnify:CR=1 FL=1
MPIDKIIDHFKSDLDKVSEELTRIKSTEFRQEVIAEIGEKKKKMAVQGKSIEDKVKEFESLNYLLDYKFTDVDPMVCEIPKTGLKQKAKSDSLPTDGQNDFSFKLQLQRKRAKAKLLLLN